MQRLIFPSELPERGVPFERSYLHRLIKAGKFPRPVKVGENRNAWLEDEIETWIKERIAHRDAAQQMEAA